MSGWKDDDAVTITYRTLCQAQAEAAASEQERIIKLLEDRRFWLIHLDKLAEAEELRTQIALIKGEK